MRNHENLINNFAETSIAVIGDLCLDLYYFLTDGNTEISVETGLKTRSVNNFKYEAGGGGNVAVNLKTLGASSVDVFGVIGADPFGKTLKEILVNSGINCNFIKTQNTDWNTHVYHKIYIDGKEEPRNDIGNFNIVNRQTVQSLLSDIEANIGKYQAVIINEQIIHGYHNELFQKGLAELIKKHEHDSLWITDCRHLNNIYDNSIRKLNMDEALALYRSEEKDSRNIPGDEELAEWLYSFWKKPVVITLGENGAIAAGNNGEIIKVPGINVIGQIDTVGAGDAFLSGFTLALASGGTVLEALNIGNISASVSVTKLFETGHPTIKELVSAGASPDFRYNAHFISSNRSPVFYRNSLMELIDLKKTNYPKVAIFDHDGTISTLRQGWEPIMKEVSIASILGNSFSQVSTGDFEKIESAVNDMIEKTTGIQTIIQMHHLKEMVLSFGYVPREEVQNPQDYKDIYNQKLLEMVSQRIELFKKGYLDINDLTIKGSVKFLESLRNNNVAVYLASGTDQEDVRREAEILGYGEYFSGGIFGSVGNVSRDPKRAVIENIVKNLKTGISPEECYVFGDGPVEMREAAKLGFTRIGLVSDEKQRFGINPEKRSRLILGGAQALIPDFSWISSLSDFMNWEIR